MTANQTIGGVPRKSLEQALKLAVVFDDGGDGADAESARGVVWILRALLDVSESQYDGMTPAQALAVSDGIDELLLGKPVTQPRGEPVAYDPAKENKQFEAWARTKYLVDLRLCDIGLYYERQTGLAHDAWQYRAKLAEQPASVAVVLPERELYTQYMLGVISSNAIEVNARKDGWNACLDELKRLNPVLKP